MLQTYIVFYINHVMLKYKSYSFNKLIKYRFGLYIFIEYIFTYEYVVTVRLQRAAVVVIPHQVTCYCWWNALVQKRWSWNLDPTYRLYCKQCITRYNDAVYIVTFVLYITNFSSSKSSSDIIYTWNNKLLKARKSNKFCKLVSWGENWLKWS